MARRRQSTPLSLMHTAAKTSQMMFEAQAVVTMRLMGMAGFWNVSPNEYSGMVLEKGDAIASSASAMQRETLAGGSPEDIFNAGAKPMQRKTSANYKRLSKKGGKF